MNAHKELVVRLLKYRNVLHKFKSLSLLKIFAENIGEAAGVSSNLVRKDFSYLKIIGNKKGGYLIDALESQLAKILGKNEEQKIIIAGFGNIAKALIGYKGFSEHGMKLVACFDVNLEQEISRYHELKIYHIKDMGDFIKQEKIKVGIIAVPENAAADIYEKMVNAGINGVLNFAPVHLREIEGTTVTSINIVLDIENLFYFVNL